MYADFKEVEANDIPAAKDGRKAAIVRIALVRLKYPKEEVTARKVQDWLATSDYKETEFKGNSLSVSVTQAKKALDKVGKPAAKTKSDTFDFPFSHADAVRMLTAIDPTVIKKLKNLASLMEQTGGDPDKAVKAYKFLRK